MRILEELMDLFHKIAVLLYKHNQYLSLKISGMDGTIYISIRVKSLIHAYIHPYAEHHHAQP